MGSNGAGGLARDRGRGSSTRSSLTRLYLSSSFAHPINSPTGLSLQRLLQQKHIKESGLELDSCPFCDFSISIENPQEKLLRCQNEDCAVVSCRNCKRVEHLPKSCEGESEQDADREERVAGERRGNAQGGVVDASSPTWSSCKVRD